MARLSKKEMKRLMVWSPVGMRRVRKEDVKVNEVIIAIRGQARRYFIPSGKRLKVKM